MRDYLKEEQNFVETVFTRKLIIFVLEGEEQTRQTWEALTYLLAKIYVQADWATIARSRKIRAEDVFQHRVKAAATMPNVRRILDKICTYLGIQSIKIQSDVIDTVQQDEKRAIAILRKESIYITLKAIECANFLFNRKKNNEEAD